MRLHFTGVGYSIMEHEVRQYYLIDLAKVIGYVMELKENLMTFNKIPVIIPLKFDEFHRKIIKFL